MGASVLIVDDHPGFRAQAHDGSELGVLVPESGARGFLPKAELSRQAIEGLLR
jgi:hypothetical protein